MMPWISQRWAIKTEQLMGATAAATAQFYAARVARLLAWLSEGFSADTVNIVAAHCMVQGGMLGGGERDAQLIDEYTVPTAAFPAAANYVALGHLHRAQQMPGAAPIWYSGSPIQVDFGEEHDTKQVLVVDIPDRGAAKVAPGRVDARCGAADRCGARSPSSRRLRRTSATRSCGCSCASSPGPAWPTTCARCCRPPSTCASRPTSRAKPPAPSRRAVERAPSPRDLFRQYLAETGHSDDDRLVALFDELLDAETV